MRLCQKQQPQPLVLPNPTPPDPPRPNGLRASLTSPPKDYLPTGGARWELHVSAEHLRHEKKILLWAPPTCVHFLPAHGERSPGLDEVIDDGAAVVSAAAPGQLGGAICHLLHRHRVWGAGRAWHNQRDRLLCEGLTHAETQTGLEHSHVTVRARKCCKDRENLANPTKYLLNNAATRDCSAREPLQLECDVSEGRAPFKNLWVLR